MVRCLAVRRLDETSAKQRDYRHCDGVRREERENDRGGKRRKQKSANPVEKNNREEDNRRREGGGKYWHCHFLASLFGCHLGLFSNFQMAENVFQNDHR